MTCVMCSRAVTSAVSKMPGVYSVHVNLVSETADVLYNPKMITTDDIGDRINLIGYEYLGIHDNNSINNEILEKKHAENQKNKLYRNKVQEIALYFFCINIHRAMGEGCSVSPTYICKKYAFLGQTV